MNVQLAERGILLILIFLLLLPAASATTTLNWEKELGTGAGAGHDITALDTDELGSYIYAGMSNGTVVAYDSDGNFIWQKNLNASVKKLKKSSDSDYLVVMTAINESVLIQSNNGNIVSLYKGIPAVDGWIRDIDIGEDGQYTFTLFDTSFFIMHRDAFFVSNISKSITTWDSTSWLNGSYAPSGEYVIISKTANQSVWSWRKENTTLYWENNPIHNVPTATERLVTNWPYRTDFVSSNPMFQNVSILLETANASITTPTYHLMNNTWVLALPQNHYNSSYDAISDIRITDKNWTFIPVNQSWASVKTSTPITITNASDVWYIVTPRFNDNTDNMGISYRSTPTPTIYGWGGLNESLMKSVDHGDTWTTVNISTGLPASAYASANLWWNGTFFELGSTATTHGLYKSDQIDPAVQGDPSVFTLRNATMNPDVVSNNNANTIVGLNGVLYLYGNYASGVWRSVDMGATWQQITAYNPYGGHNLNSEGNTFKGEMWAFGGYSVVGAIPGARHSSDGITWVTANATFPPTYGDYATDNGAYGVWNPFGVDEEILYYNQTDGTVYNTTDGTIWKNSGRTFPHITQQAVQMAGDGYAVYITPGTQWSNPVHRSLYTWREYNLNTWYNTSGYKNLVFNKTLSGASNYSIFYGNMSAAPFFNDTKTIGGSPGTPIHSANTGSFIQNEATPQSGAFIRYNTSVTLDGTVQTMDIPESGGLVAITTTTNITHILIGDTGFTTGYTRGTTSSGTSYDVVSADSGTYILDARGTNFDIYTLAGVSGGSYATGSYVKAVDIASKTGLWAVAGGDDGKLYVISKDLSSDWALDFSGDTAEKIKALAMSMRGEYIAVGREGGSLEYYAAAAAGSSSTSSATVQSYPHYVTFHILGAYGQGISGVNVTAQGITTSTGYWDWLATLTGSPIDEVPINGTLMHDTTDAYGAVTFYMVPTTKYNVTFTKTGYTIPYMYIIPQDEDYIIQGEEIPSFFEKGFSELDKIKISVSTTMISDSEHWLNISYNDTLSHTVAGVGRIYVYQKNETPWGQPTELKNWPVTGNVFTNSTKVTHIKQISGYVYTNITHTDAGLIQRGYPFQFNSIPVSFIGFGKEFALLAAMGIMIFTAMLGGASTTRMTVFVVCIEGWIFYAFHWFQSLIDRIDAALLASGTTGLNGDGIVALGLVIMTVVSLFANIELRKRKEKY